MPFFYLMDLDRSFKLRNFRYLRELLGSGFDAHILKLAEEEKILGSGCVQLISPAAPILASVHPWTTLQGAELKEN